MASAAAAVVPAGSGFGAKTAVLGGDFSGDGKFDLALTGSEYFASVPVAASAGDGSFRVTTAVSAQFAGWAAEPGVQVVGGDFDGDGRQDIALVGGAGWSHVPVALSNGDGSFRVSNEPTRTFAEGASVPGARAVAFDFNGDGKTDIGLVGGAGWITVELALSFGDGTFEEGNPITPAFAAQAALPGAQVFAGDVNGDGRGDLVTFATTSAARLVVALSNPNGFTEVVRDGQAVAGVTYFSGDFNADGRMDIGSVDQSGTIATGLAGTDGTFAWSSVPSGIADFATVAAASGSRVIPGDFDGDQRTDILLVGKTGSNMAPVAFSVGDGTFRFTGESISAVFADAAAGAQSASNPARVITGDFDGQGDGAMDVALVDPFKARVLVAMSVTDGTFDVKTAAAPGFDSMLDGIPGVHDDFDPVTCKNLQMCQSADINDDMIADFVGFVPADTSLPGMAGAVLVSLGTGNTPSFWKPWGNGFCTTAGQECRLANVTGTPAADLVEFTRNTPGQEGDVRVAVADAAHRHFSTATKWNDFLCPAAGETCLFADVNGDFKLDVVDFVHSARPGREGAVFVALNHAGNSFDPPALWAASGFCKDPGEICDMGYLDDGHYADIAVRPDTAHNSSQMGQVYVARNTGAGSWGTPTLWGTNICINVDICRLASVDTNFDGHDDVVFKNSADSALTTGQFWVAYNGGFGFSAPVVADLSPEGIALGAAGQTAKATTASATGVEQNAVSTLTCDEIRAAYHFYQGLEQFYLAVLGAVSGNETAFQSYFNFSFTFSRLAEGLRQQFAAKGCQGIL
ncbi:FG-GAP repeat domain-containing protein [Micromonospora chersina]|uniref:FG-GAP repeat domain-containing protein n=1 Tax=Micromonospora chersina TaxID=47854 RepID=UPI0037BA8027